MRVNQSRQQRRLAEIERGLPLDVGDIGVAAHGGDAAGAHQDRGVRDGGFADAVEKPRRAQSEGTGIGHDGLYFVCF